MVRRGLAAYAARVEPGPYWIAINHGAKVPQVAPLAVLRGRLTALVVQVEADGLHSLLYMPALQPSATNEPAALRRLEHLQRALRAGRLEAARAIIEHVATTAADDPFAGCLAGYALLRQGLQTEMRGPVEAAVEAASELSDPLILRGEYAAATGGTASRQSFVDAIAAKNLPIFAEGLTRLVEGLRANDVLHPRAAIVRYLFQQHVRGSMWSMFNPRRWEEGTRVVTGADTGFEA
jgi:hypothetical protein